MASSLQNRIMLPAPKNAFRDHLYFHCDSAIQQVLQVSRNSFCELRPNLSIANTATHRRGQTRSIIVRLVNLFAFLVLLALRTSRRSRYAVGDAPTPTSDRPVSRLPAFE